MSDRWLQDGQFSMNVPDDWMVRQLEGSTEVVPRGGNVAVHVSTLKKTDPAPATARGARQLFDYFLVKNELSADESQVVVGRVPLGWACQAYCQRRSGQSNAWFVRVIVTGERGIFASVCANNADADTFVEGTAILESLRAE